MKLDEQKLKHALAKMLPEKIKVISENEIRWIKSQCQECITTEPIKETEWLHVCHLIEETLTNNEADVYGLRINEIMLESETKKFQSVCDWYATWQQRALALCQVKGIS